MGRGGGVVTRVAAGFICGLLCGVVIGVLSAVALLVGERSEGR